MLPPRNRGGSLGCPQDLWVTSTGGFHFFPASPKPLTSLPPLPVLVPPIHPQAPATLSVSGTVLTCSMYSNW